MYVLLKDAAARGAGGGYLVCTLSLLHIAGVVVFSCYSRMRRCFCNDTSSNLGSTCSSGLPGRGAAAVSPSGRETKNPDVSSLGQGRLAQ